MTPDPITPERVTLTEAEALAKFMQDQWLNGVIFDPSPEGGPPKINWQEYADRILSHLSNRLRAAQANAWDECAWQAWGLDESLWPFRNPYRVQSEGGGDE